MNRWRALASANVRLSRLRAAARFVLAVEWVWPTLSALLCVLGIFLIVSWVGIWSFIPGWARVGLWLGLIAALSISLRGLWSSPHPTTEGALRRLDFENNADHRPAQTATDTLSSADRLSKLLWAAHLTNARAKADRLRLPRLRLLTPARDRLALRAAVLVGVIAAGFVAGPDKWGKLLAAFQMDQAQGGATARIDAWIDPPPYTGRPPIVLMSSGLSAGSSKSFQVPTGAEIVIRSQNKLSEVVVSSEGLQASQNEDLAERKYLLRETSKIVLRDKNGSSNPFEFFVVPDNKPLIEFQNPPSSDGSGLLYLSYRASDDYGVTSAEAILRSPTVRGKKSEDPLFTHPSIPLSLPSSNFINDGVTLFDLAENPWAGVDVSIQLIALDEAGNEGFSDELRIEMPQRIFTKPLAKAIIELRRHLAFFPAEKPIIIASLQALEAAPDRFSSNAGQHLAMRFLNNRLQGAKDREELREAVTFMWEMALRIEEGDLLSAEQGLRLAERNLLNALENKAGEDELRRLTNELRMAMERFLQELSEKSPENQAEASKDLDRQQVIGSRDLNKSIDEIERMARSGKLDDAKEALEQLKELLRNLKSAQKAQQGRSAQESNKALNQLDQMLRDQQQLRDRTFDFGRDRNPEDGSGDLKQSQNEIRERLQELQRRMRQFGMRMDEGLEDAEEAMRDAERHLDEPQRGHADAVDAQGRAIEGLRKGAEALARQRQESGQGEGEQAVSPQGGNGLDRGSDPLGRESRSRGDQSRSTFDPVEAAPPQRAQQLLEELRRRLGEPGRESFELEYLERLMRRY